MTQKKVEYFKNQEKVGEKFSECNNIFLPAGSEYFEEYWLECLREIHHYQKKPVLFSQHLLITDDRLKKGLEIYQGKNIKELVKTDVDIRGIIKSRTEKDKEHDVVIKNWKSTELLRYKHQMISYLEDLTVSCSCKDFIINGKYRNNCSLLCPHISAVLWWMMDNTTIPKFLITPKEKKDDWYEKSKTVELETGLYGVSMKQFQQFLNVLVLRDFRGISTSLAYSIHKEANKGYESKYPNGIKPTWITFDNIEAVEKLIKANIRGLVEMLASRGNSEKDIKEAINKLIPTEDKDKRIKDLEEECGSLTNKLNEVGLELEELKKGWFKKLLNKIKGWFK